MTSMRYQVQKEPIVIEAEEKEIISLLTEFYWELDEVYISDYSGNWFISINHNFELSFYGKNKQIFYKNMI